ncbi:phage baseplate assembly protein V [Porphyromonas gingivalis]|uniref:Phage baseplate assembly protein V n=1 Tax=Porphyromonas gingivalis TaxID=837 RepID=A0AAE9XKA9_PORGN|nr:phage baseplate assembly protein V [Porphyromonas gingivalis]WCG03969.1 phage baseplate assembly protein V [Porphyromonas gingivalis]SJL33489.1 Phage-related baseplate assembly protein [Porphyromonas gingivalis]
MGAGANLNAVKTKIRLDGEEILFESLILDQTMNSCHRFEIVREYPTHNQLWKETPEKLIGAVGARVLIRFDHIVSGRFYEFSGWVTDIRIDTGEESADTGVRLRSSRVRIIGRGDAVSLDGAPTMNSFIDLQLSDIVSQVTRDAYFKVECNPRYKGILPYAMQYGESNFEFLNRLSRIYGELFYYDGRTLFFGTPKNADSEKLFFDEDLLNLRTGASARPRKYAHYDYAAEEDKFLRFQADDRIPGGNPLIDNVANRADRLFPEKGVIPSNSPVYTEFNLQDLVEERKADAVGRMLYIEAETQTCRISLGSVVDILFPEAMDVPALGKYRITAIQHYVSTGGKNYSNRFLASPALIDCVPEAYACEVKAYPEMAIVSDNKDPKNHGRVKVQFDWQKPKGLSTNWLRVQTPDAGSSKKVATNRGFVAIPEEGDQVMVGFEYGDPHRPFVMGSLFHGKSGIGGGVGNKIKSLSTRSGNRLELNDEDGSVLLADPGSVKMRFDGKGNATTNANVSHSINAGNKSSINVGATKEQPAQAVISADADGNILIDGKTKITIQVGENRIEISKNGIVTTAADGRIETLAQTGSVSIESASAEVSLRGSSETKVGGGEKTYVSGGKVEINS